MKKKILSMLCAVTMTVTLVASMPMNTYSAGRGDFNGDGKVNTFDVREMMRLIAKGDVETVHKIWGDYDFDSKFNTNDARKVLDEIMNTEEEIVREAADDFGTPTGKDWWGENSINVLGDSISFGVGTSNDKTTDGSVSGLLSLTGGIPEYSYVSYVKKAVQKENNGKMNYGFTSAYPTAWPGVARSEEIHGWPVRDADSNGNPYWVCDNNDDGNRLMSIGMTCTTAGFKTMTYRLRNAYKNKYKYFCVYYDAVDNGGSFCISYYDGSGQNVPNVNGSTSYVSTKLASGETRQTKRTAFYKLSDCYTDDKGSPLITICHDNTTNPVTITGIGYYKELPKDNNADGYVTFNSFTRGGVSLMNLSNTVLSQAAKADTLILGLGYNDFCFNHTRVNNGEFKAKIDHLIKECNANGTNVIVNDYAWNNPVVSNNWADSQRTANAIVKSELQRLARETGGIYIDQQALCGQAVIDSLNNKQEIGANSNMTAGDNVHPNNAGHKMMAKNVVAALGLTWTESWT